MHNDNGHVNLFFQISEAKACVTVWEASTILHVSFAVL